jgi:ABC-type Fe3+-hydroxamate transport system substrate-binding protein
VAVIVGIAAVVALAVWAERGRRPAPAPKAGSAPRLVVLSPALSVTLQDVGAGGLIVGRHDFDETLPDVPPAGHQFGIDYEALLALRPTHVLLEWGQRPLPDRLVALAERNGWTLRSYELDTLEEIEATADQLQQTFGDADAEPASAALERAWARSDKPLGRVGRVLLLGVATPPTALGPGSFHDEILRRLGATPAIDEGTPWMELDAEDVVAMNPDAIVLIAPARNGTGIGATGQDALADMGVIAGLDVAAVRSGRVAILDGFNAHKPSTAMGDLADDLRTVLEGWADETP